MKGENIVVTIDEKTALVSLLGNFFPLHSPLNGEDIPGITKIQMIEPAIVRRCGWVA